MEQSGLRVTPKILITFPLPARESASEIPKKPSSPGGKLRGAVRILLDLPLARKVTNRNNLLVGLLFHCCSS